MRCPMLVLLTAWSCSGTAVAQTPERQGMVEVGKRLPNIGAHDLDARTHSSDQLLAMPGTNGLLVQLWATWCVPCVEEIDKLARDKARLRAAGVRVLLVNLGEEDKKVARFVQQRDLVGFVVILDRSGYIADDQFKLLDPRTKQAGLPLSVVADRGGVVRAIFRKTEGDYVGKVLDVLGGGSK